MVFVWEDPHNYCIQGAVIPIPLGRPFHPPYQDNPYISGAALAPQPDNAYTTRAALAPHPDNPYTRPAYFYALCVVSTRSA